MFANEHGAFCFSSAATALLQSGWQRRSRTYAVRGSEWLFPARKLEIPRELTHFFFKTEDKMVHVTYHAVWDEEE
ncbi:hypothetical protein, partial [Segatella oulorum]|uniref:hypothetical protein n=1 Tax=Segatella oulorum TaxID=28136 RepID=UPI0036234FB1